MSDTDETNPLVSKDNSSSDYESGSRRSLGLTPPTPKRLTMWGLVFLSFFAVSGGPYGMEDAIRVGYPLFTLLGMICIPWIWSLPSALMTAELSTMMPENGGFVIWVKTAFGPFWAFQEAWWSFVNNLFDLSIYPATFENYIQKFTTVALQFYQQYLIRIGVLLLCFLLNLFGVDVLSKVSGIFVILVLAPFVIMMALGAKHINPKDWIKIPSDLKSVNWGLFFTTICWSTGGFDNMSQVSGDLDNPKKSFPRAMIIVLVAMILVVVLPLLVLVSVDTDYDNWNEGHFAVIGEEVSGKWLRIVVIIGACISSVGVLNTYLLTCSEMLAAWGEKDLLGFSFLQLQSRWKTPYVALIINCVLIGMGSVLSFEFLVQMDQLFYSIGLVLEYLSLIYLRWKLPEAHRPYVIPMHRLVLIGFCILPIAFCAFTALSAMAQGWLVFGITLGLIAIGIPLYPLITFVRGYMERKKAAQALADEDDMHVN